MADGATHARIALGALIVGTGAAGLALPPPWRYSVPVGLAMGWALTPDLDQDGSTIEEARWRKVPLVGEFLYLGFRVVFWPYALIMPHRSLWSHGLVIGTALRMAYTVGLVSLVFPSLGVWAWLLAHLDITGGVFAGWLVQDALPLLLDMWPGKKKRTEIIRPLLRRLSG